MNLTKRQIDHIVNVNGLRTPRSKEMKAGDQERYEQRYKKAGNIQKSVFEIVKQTI